jgi:hypothetical protein
MTRRKLRKTVISVLVAGLTVFGAGAVALAQTAGDPVAPAVSSVPAANSSTGTTEASAPESEAAADNDAIECDNGTDPVTGAECDGGPAANSDNDATEAQAPEAAEAAEAPEATDTSEVQSIGTPPGNDQTGEWDGDYNYEG